MMLAAGSHMIRLHVPQSPERLNVCNPFEPVKWMGQRSAHDAEAPGDREEPASWARHESTHTRAGPPDPVGHRCEAGGAECEDHSSVI